jgi:hypothetical protein
MDEQEEEEELALEAPKQFHGDVPPPRGSSRPDTADGSGRMVPREELGAQDTGHPTRKGKALPGRHGQQASVLAGRDGTLSA